MTMLPAPSTAMLHGFGSPPAPQRAGDARAGHARLMYAHRLFRVLFVRCANKWQNVCSRAAAVLGHAGARPLQREGPAVLPDPVQRRGVRSLLGL